MNIKTFVNPYTFSCNVFVCSTQKSNFIIDMGYYGSDIKSYIKTLPGIDFVLQTHGHFDHIQALNDFQKDFPEVPVYIHESEIEVALDENKNVSSLMGEDFVPEVDFSILREGTAIIHDEKILVYHTPGHTQGSCTFYFKDENCIFFGDTIIEFGIGRTDLPTGNEATLFSSLNKITKLNLPEKTMCYFGHGNTLTYRELLDDNSYLMIQAPRCELDDVMDFRLEANKVTYAGFSNQVDSTRLDSHDYRYSSGDYTYHDSYVGGEQFAGEEAVWKNGKAMWAMNYCGRVLSQKFSGDFLKEALRAADRKMPYRGPEFFQNGEYTYKTSVTGDFTWFQGVEEIFCGEEKVYECYYHGGVMK